MCPEIEEVQCEKQRMRESTKHSLLDIFREAMKGYGRLNTEQIESIGTPVKWSADGTASGSGCTQAQSLRAS